MVEYFLSLNPVYQALVATTITWLSTALGAAVVFFAKNLKRRLMDSILGFAAGVMIAASFWSLLAPGIDMAKELGINPWLTAALGFLSGGLLMRIVDKLLPHLHPDLFHSPEGIKTSWRRSVLVVTAVTLHNIPEGFAIGVMFGAIASGAESITVASAVILAIGIGLQNIPEGAAVSMPLRREGLGRWKSFMIGQYSGMVEPVAGVLGAIFVIKMQSMLPFALCFAAGAMMFVVVEELIPEAQSDKKNVDIATMATLIGFAIMMILDVAFT
jgi:ZIP family zinc transporter